MPLGLFLKLVGQDDLIDVYSQYCSNYPAALDKVVGLRHNSKKFARHLTECKEDQVGPLLL